MANNKAINDLNKMLEQSNSKSFDLNRTLVLLSQIVIAQNNRIEDLELTVDGLERKISNL